MSEALLQLLEQQRHCTVQLLDVLEQESQAVLSGDLARLHQVGRAKESCCQAISNIETQWPAPMRGADVQQWIHQQDEAIARAWDDLVEQLRHCRRQNDANGLLIAERQQWVAQQLNPAGSSTYGSGGQAAVHSTSTWASSA